uniref:Uncharacterized protein n=1 Tax=Cucumis melo TaxID=3656 RepID=A0A9I9EGV5_CUCME
MPLQICCRRLQHPKICCRRLQHSPKLRRPAESTSTHFSLLYQP